MLSDLVTTKVDVTRLSATELAAGIRAGDFSATAVVEAHIQRIEAVDGDLNAVVIPLFDQARRAAKAADDMQARGEPLGLLHGVPVTIKEQYRVAGTQTTLGATNKIGNVYEDEGPLVSKLREAGAIILGKTNIMQTLAGLESDNRVYGRAQNPFDLERTPGGSSGGEAAIIAAYGSPLGLAGDYGGSIRVPAHFCGVHGFKPTSGRLSNADFPPDLLSAGQETIIPQPGPIARTVADLRLALALFAETSMTTTPDSTPPVPWPDPEKVHVPGLRVGYYTDNGYFPASPALRRAVMEAVAALQALGVSAAPITPPDAAEAVRIFLGAVSANGGGDYQRLLGAEKPLPQVAGLFRGFTLPAWVRKVLPRVLRARGQMHLAYVISCLGRRSAEVYWEIVAARTAYQARFAQALAAGGFDAVICPPYALPAVTHGSTAHLFPAMTYSLVFNVLGAPAGVVSLTRVQSGEESDRQRSRDQADITAAAVEQGSAGLPVGVQVVARNWREDVALALMAALEASFSHKTDFPVRPEVRARQTSL